MDLAEFNWKNVDLNLLVAFQALMETKSVTKAASKCFVSQSAMSHSLQRLRALLDDPLFERVGSHMEPTPRAIDISAVIDGLLHTVRNEVLQPKSFVPAAYTGVWKIGLSDYAEQAFGPFIFDLIKRSSPESKIVFYNVNKGNYQQAFDEHKLDIAIGSFNLEKSKYQLQQLYTEQHQCLFDRSTFESQRSLSVDEFVSVEHALVSPNGTLSTQVDIELERLGYQRQVSFSSSNFLTVGQLVKGRKMVCIVPKLVASRVTAVEESLVAVPPPINVPDFDIQLIYRTNKHQNEKNGFLRGKVQEAVLGVIGAD